MNGNMEHGDLYVWKRKYEAKNQQYLKLKEIARLAGKEFEDIVVKYQQNLTQHKKCKDEFVAMKKQLSEKEEELGKMESYLRPFVSEFKNMKENYQSEMTFREKAEELASSIYQEKVIVEKQNKRLKRQSEHIFGLMKAVPDFNIADILLENEDSDEVSSGSDLSEINSKTDELNMIKLLRDEVEAWRKKFEDYETSTSDIVFELDNMRQKFQATQNSLCSLTNEKENLEKELSQLQERHDLIYEENKIIIEELQLKNKLQEKTEEYASKCHFEAEAMKRQSMAVMCGVESQQLDEAILEIVKLREELVQQELQVHNRSEQCKDGIIIEQLQEKVEEMKKKLDEANKRAEDFHYKNRILNEELDLARKISHSALPPPPPPPPPPPIQAQKFSNIFDLIRGRKNSTKTAAGFVDTTDGKGVPSKGVKEEAMSNLMNEMMNRIKSGQHLKKSEIKTHPREPQQSETVNELEAFLERRKKLQSKGNEEVPSSVATNMTPITEEKCEPVETFEPQLRRPSLAPFIKKKPECKCISQEKNQ